MLCYNSVFSVNDGILYSQGSAPLSMWCCMIHLQENNIKFLLSRLKETHNFLSFSLVIHSLVLINQRSLSYFFLQKWQHSCWSWCFLYFSCPWFLQKQVTEMCFLYFRNVNIEMFLVTSFLSLLFLMSLSYLCLIK